MDDGETPGLVNTPDSMESEILFVEKPKLFGILDVDLEDLTTIPKFTEPETLKALDILGYIPKDLTVISPDEYSSIPGSDDIRARVMIELNKRRLEMIEKVKQLREEIIRRQNARLPSPDVEVEPSNVSIPPAKKKRRGGKKKKKSKANTEDPNESNPKAKKGKKRKGRKFKKPKTLLPVDVHRERRDEALEAERVKLLKDLEKKNADIERRLKNVEQQRRDKALEMKKRVERASKAASSLRLKADKEIMNSNKKTMNKLQGAEKRRQQILKERQDLIRKKSLDMRKKSKAVESEARKLAKEKESKLLALIKKQEERRKKLEEDKKKKLAEVQQRRHAEVISRLNYEAKHNK